MPNIYDVFSDIQRKLDEQKSKIRQIIDIHTDLAVHVAVLKDKILSSGSAQCIYQNELNTIASSTHITSDLVSMSLNTTGIDLNRNLSLTSTTTSSLLNQNRSQLTDTSTSGPSIGDDSNGNNNLDGIRKLSPRELNDDRQTGNDAVNETQLSNTNIIDEHMMTKSSSLNNSDAEMQSIVSHVRCATCKNNFSSINKLQRHSIRCSKLHCVACNRFFTRNKSFIRHMKLHDRRDGIEEQRTVGENGTDIMERFGCRVCGRNFMRLWDLQQHRTSHNKATYIECIVCKKSFMSSQMLKTHQQIHENIGNTC